MDPARIPVPAVALARYPSDAARVAELRAAHVPRLLFVDEHADPPITTDVEEDWIREPADQRDVEARITGLMARIERPGPERPVLDDSLLRVGERWVALSPIEARLAEPLVAHLGVVVSRETLIDAAWPDEAAAPNTLNAHLSHLRRRLQDLGLALSPVRSRGYVLECAEAASSAHGGLSLVASLED